jgi:hypothetical protein
MHDNPSSSVDTGIDSAKVSAFQLHSLTGLGRARGIYFPRQQSSLYQHDQTSLSKNRNVHIQIQDALEISQISRLLLILHTLMLIP